MRWTVPLMLATSLHAAAIGVVVRWHQAGGADPRGAPPVMTASFRVEAAPEAARQVSESREISAGSAAPMVSEPSEIEVPAERTVTTTPEPPPDDVTAYSTDAVSEVATSSARIAREVYHPRNELSVAPRLQGVVDIAYPAEEADHGRHEATLAVYIDEHGHVRKVESNEGELPPSFIAAARNAFLSARFLPGELHGQVVKSRIQVAVVFEARPAELVAASRALPTH